MSLIDDSALLHAEKRYDPVKAREYYLRTRQLKGRRGGSGAPPPLTSRVTGQSPPSSQRRSSSGSKLSPSQRKKLLDQKAALENRLERLQDVLAQLVEAAKKRSGVETETTKDASSPETKDKPAEKLTRAEKREKAEAAREAYEPDPTVNQEVKQLQEQVQDVLAQIKAAAADAQRQRSTQSNTEATIVRR
jgi:hypothetical protein